MTITREPNPRVPENEITFVDLFAGCGGLSLGLMRAGWTNVFAVEKAVDAFKTYKHNLLDNGSVGNLDWPNWLPKKSMSVETLLRNYKEELGKLATQITLVAGGPPCQGFSMAGMRKSSDPRNQLVYRFFDFVRLLKPKLVLLENVEGIRKRFLKGKKARNKLAPSDKLTKKLRTLGYTSRWIDLEASRFGVAQSRSRSFLIAVSREIRDRFPNHELEEYIETSRRRFLEGMGLPVSGAIAVRSAISDLQTTFRCGIKARRRMKCVDSSGFEQIVYDGPETKYQEILREGMEDDKTPPNSMRLVNHREYIVRRFNELHAHQRKGNDLSKILLNKYGVKKHSFSILDSSMPAPTITSIPDDFIHYCEPRVLTVRELARIQSFPDWFDFLGRYTTGGERRRFEVPRYTQVANAVSPFIAEVLGFALKQLHRDLLSESNQRNRGVIT